MLRSHCARCPDCQKKIDLVIGQIADESQLRWSLSYNCPYCSCVMEMDDVGFPPEEIRKKIMKQFGVWQLTIPTTEYDHKVRLFKALRQVFNLSIQEVSEFALKTSIL